MTGFINALPGAVSQGLIWGIMAIGVYITYKILDIADLTVDGSFCTGGAVFAVLFSGGVSLPAALLAAAMALGVHALALGRLGGDALPWYGAVILLAVAYLLFSILPPTGRLFAEQAGVPAASIPF